MSGHERPIAERAAALRRSFDRSFADAPRLERPQVEDLLGIGIRGDPYAVRVADIVALVADKPVTTLPGPLPELAGIAGFRGATVPIYDLGALLGYSERGALRWLVILAAQPLGLAFDRFDGHLRVARDAIVAEQTSATPRRHVREVIRTGDVGRPIVDVVSLLGMVERRARQAGSWKER